MPAAARVRATRWWLVPVVIVVAALALGAGMVGRRLYHPAVPAPAEPPPVEATTSAVPPAAPPGPGSVRMTQDAANHPLHRQVRDVLQRYFDGINAKNYRYWRGAVTGKLAATKPRPEWQRAFRTTRDGTILVHRIEPARGPGLRVLLTFVSTQAVRDAPRDFPHSCIRWRVVFPLARQDGSWRVAADQAGAAPHHTAC